MRKINIKDIAEESWISPKGKFAGASKEISVALGRKPQSMDLNERQPFDVEICRNTARQDPLPVSFARRSMGVSLELMSRKPRTNEDREMASTKEVVDNGFAERSLNLGLLGAHGREKHTAKSVQFGRPIAVF